MEPARDTLIKVVAQALNRLPAAEVPLAAWQFSAGQAVAAKTTALGFENGVLTVEVPDATWRNQLRDMAPQFLATLNLYTRVERLEFVLPPGVRELAPQGLGKRKSGIKDKR